MNRSRCDRTWQAGAREDGRLDKRDLESFERHAQHCPECTREIAALAKIAQTMAALTDGKRTDLEHRRARQELLRRANEQFLTDKPSPKPWRMWVLAGSVALASMGLIWQRFAAAPVHAPTFDVADVAHAVWQTETIASTSRVTLRSGTAAFHVEHLEREEKFFVDLPDGRIEVRGTRFVVDVVEGKTHSVEVTEGIVWLDIPSFHGLLHAGERWPSMETAHVDKAESPLPIPAAAQTETAAPEPMTATEKTNGAVDVSGPNLPKSTTPKNASPEPSADDAPTPAGSAMTAKKDDAGPRFAEAMSAFSAGNDARAEQLFVEFIRDFPRDGRAEDAMFLRAKSRARRGDAAGAAAIAREYLKAFPRGFRRPEAERLAGETTSAPRN